MNLYRVLSTEWEETIPNSRSRFTGLRDEQDETWIYPWDSPTPKAPC